MKPLACNAETTLAEVSKALMSYTVTLGIKSVETLNGVPICYCQWIGVDAWGCHQEDSDKGFGNIPVSASTTNNDNTHLKYFMCLVFILIINSKG